MNDNAATRIFIGAFLGIICRMLFGFPVLISILIATGILLCSTHAFNTFRDFFKWLFSFKTLCIIALSFICWQAYKVRMSYERYYDAKIAAYEKL